MDSVVSRPVHRVTTIRPVTLAGEPRDEAPLSEKLYLGVLGRYADEHLDYLPGVLVKEKVVPDDWVVESCWLWLFRVSAGVYALVVTVDLRGDHRDVISALDRCMALNLRVNGEPLLTLLRSSIGMDVDVGYQRHQIVFWSDQVAGQQLDWDLVQRLIYRADLDALPGFCDFDQPRELNRRPGSAAYLGSYVTVMSGQQDYIENFALVSALQIVGAKWRTEQIKAEARVGLRLLEALRGEDPADLRRRRDQVGQLAARIRNLQVALAFDVEDFATIQDVIPSLRVEAYHVALWTAAGMEREVKAASAMVDRLASAVAAEQQAVGSLEALNADWRRTAVAVAVTWVTVIAVPVQVWLAFFSVNARQLHANSSLFDYRKYWGLFDGMAVVILAAFALWLGLRWWGKVVLRREAGGGSR